MSFDGLPLSTVTTQDADPIYRDLLAQVTTIITTAGQIGPFDEPSRGTTACTQEADAQSFSYRTRSGDPILDEAWPAVLEEVTTLLQSEGFTDLLTMHDEPGHHLVYFRRPDGADVRFGSEEASTFAISTACHPLPATSTGAP